MPETQFYWIEDPTTKRRLKVGSRFHFEETYPIMSMGKALAYISGEQLSYLMVDGQTRRRIPWRIPTIDELQMMYEQLHKKGAGEFKKRQGAGMGALYYSSTMINPNPKVADPAFQTYWLLNFDTGQRVPSRTSSQNCACWVRLVMDDDAPAKPTALPQPPRPAKPAAPAKPADPPRQADPPKPPVAVTDGLALHLDGGPSSFTGAEWRDLSGNNRHATVTDCAAVSEHGGGVAVPGTNGVKIAVPASELWSMDPKGPGSTFELWWRKGENASPWGGCIIGTYPDGGAGTWQVFQNASGPTYSQEFPQGILLYANGESEPNYVWPRSTHAVDEVAMMTVVQQGQTFKLYKNGVYVSDLKRPKFAESGSRRLVLGTNANGGEEGKITFYSVRWYTRPLTAAEIAQNYEAQRRRFGK